MKNYIYVNNVKEVKEFLNKKFNKEVLERIGVTIKRNNKFRTIDVNLKISEFTYETFDGIHYHIPKNIKLNNKEKEVIKFLEKNIFKLPEPTDIKYYLR